MSQKLLQFLLLNAVDRATAERAVQHVQRKRSMYQPLSPIAQKVIMAANHWATGAGLTKGFLAGISDVRVFETPGSTRMEETEGEEELQLMPNPVEKGQRSRQTVHHGGHSMSTSTMPDPNEVAMPDPDVIITPAQIRDAAHKMAMGL